MLRGKMCVCVFLQSERENEGETDCVCRAEAKLQAVWVIRRVLFEIVSRCGFIDRMTSAQSSSPHLMENKQHFVWKSVELEASGVSVLYKLVN